MYKIILLTLLLASCSAEYTLEYFSGTADAPAFDDTEIITTDTATDATAFALPDGDSWTFTFWFKFGSLPVAADADITEGILFYIYPASGADGVDLGISWDTDLDELLFALWGEATAPVAPR